MKFTPFLALSLFAFSTTKGEDEGLPILFPNANGNFHFKPLSRESSISISKSLVNESSFDDAEANNLKTIEDFARFYDFNLPAINRKPVITITNRFGGAISSADSNPKLHDLPQANCNPELTTVPLDLPHEEGVTFFPTCVKVERCGGCCLLSHHSCQPTEKEEIFVKAVKIREVVTRSRRRVRNAEPDFASIPVERHLKCDCQCRLKESECDSSIQNYDPDYCDCTCKDKEREKACSRSRDHFWDFDSCKCLCRNTLSCSSGQVFDHKTCSCTQA